MKVLIDTSVWSQALRRSKRSSTNNRMIDRLKELIDEHRAQMIGPIRQEILSGIRSNQQFQALREKLQAFPDLPLYEAEYERAAEMSNICRTNGIQGSHTDFLICAAAEKYQLSILTADKDFQLYEEHLPITLLINPSE